MPSLSTLSSLAKTDIAVVDPHIHIRGGHPDPEIRDARSQKKKIILALRASVWAGPSPRSATVVSPKTSFLDEVLGTRLS